MATAAAAAPKKVVVGRIAQVIGAVVDVEFDNVNDVPPILNALTTKVMVEVFRSDFDRMRDVSLLPKQIDGLQKELAKVEAAEKEYGASGKCKADRKASLDYMKTRGALKPALLAQLEAEVRAWITAA